jgi:alkyl hydroperoxide reductase subunit AhpF
VQLEDLAESTPDRVRILKKAKVTKLVKDGEKVVGVEYQKDGKHVSVQGWRIAAFLLRLQNSALISSVH